MPLQNLPKWLQFGAFMLAMNAGMINVLGLISLIHQSVSHMTGNVSLLAISLIDDDYSAVFFLISILISYVFGSSVSGYVLGSSHFGLDRRYGIPLSLVTLSIIFCWLFIPYYPRYALLWACFSMGIQNAMVSHYRGAIIRTTHLSGVLTDIGLALGYCVKGLKLESKKFILHLLILLGFISGSIVAAFVEPYLHLQAFLVPAGLSLILSLVYWVLYFRHQSAQKL